MSEYDIVKGGKPMPNGYKGRPLVYPFDRMEVGDTFDAPRDVGLTTSGSDKRQHMIHTSAKRYGQRNGKTFMVRIVDEYTVRCKRIS